ncbi:MAG TPA: type II toxin-antitoxin system VapC family toxin [Acidobacteriaceae bacterium]|jgi:predicted nucleic-acid-binding protein|nr:type II toxin-antitoxin system VapC family toxin [Acidobacteriaceae bacterium]
MKITADTNVLVRALVRDDAAQARAALRILREAEVIALPLAGLCELVWVLRRVYRFQRNDVILALQTILEVGNVSVNRAAADAGLATLRAGGDFADGVIAWDGEWLGGEAFVSFDKGAVSVLKKQGIAARLLE